MEVKIDAYVRNSAQNKPQVENKPKYTIQSRPPTPYHPNPKRTSVGSSEAREDDVYFLIPRNVTVLYGPFMSMGIMDYRTERLQGLKTFLERLGVTVQLKPCSDHVNLVRVWFLDEQVFSCKITQLMHGGDGELDPICWEAAESVEKFIRKVLKGLRKTKALPPAELKRPFCPCFHVNDPQEYTPPTTADANVQVSNLENIRNSVQEHPPPPSPDKKVKGRKFSDQKTEEKDDRPAEEQQESGQENSAPAPDKKVEERRLSDQKTEDKNDQPTEEQQELSDQKTEEKGDQDQPAEEQQELSDQKPEEKDDKPAEEQEENGQENIVPLQDKKVEERRLSDQRTEEKDDQPAEEQEENGQENIVPLQDKKVEERRLSDQKTEEKNDQPAEEPEGNGQENEE